jgi:hypothetical protein
MDKGRSVILKAHPEPAQKCQARITSAISQYPGQNSGVKLNGLTLLLLKNEILQEG